ncbi:MAG TPA: hypothetical protein VFO18_16380 [Methylomirabilota bacterium]|nr:hypothetical protein [Methylomirabilota bacterium]
MILVQQRTGVKHSRRRAEGEAGAAGGALRVGDDGGASGRSRTGRPGRGGKAQRREDLLHDGRVRDGGDQAQPAAAPRTRQHVQPEGADEEAEVTCRVRT